MKLRYWFCLAVVALFAFVATAQFVTPGLPTSRYPNISTADPSDLLNIARTNTTIGLGVRTNHNMLIRDLQFQFSSAVSNFVLATSNSLFTSAGGAVLWTNSGGIVMLTTNGPVSIVSTGLLGGLVVTQDIRFLGHNSASNSVWVCTNATTGEGEWRTASATVSSLGFNQDLTRLILQSFPNRGALYYVGTNGTPQTFGARISMEFNTTTQSVRWGALGNVALDNHHYIPSSNFWDAPNLGWMTWAFGSNHIVNAPLSTIAGGVKNAIYTNASHSYIGGGTNNAIETNAHASVIGGGDLNKIHVDNHHSIIGGGSANNINGGSPNSTIGGGTGNTIHSSNGTIAGGDNNVIGAAAPSEALQSTIGGGSQNGLNSQYATIAGGRLNSIARSAISATIGGGEDNSIGSGASGSDASTIGGGDGNTIGGGATAQTATISGGSGNTIGASGSFSTIGGGQLNLVDVSLLHGLIPGGVSNYLNQSFSWVMGNWGTNTDSYTGLMSSEKVTVRGRTNSTFVAGVHASPTNRVAGAGNGNTNYTLLATTDRMYFGSSNVNIVAVMRTEAGLVMPWTCYITNLSADTWGISFSSATNRWKFQSWMYGTNAPSVLTNNTLLRLNGESEGTNTLVTYQYFSPGL